MIILVVTNVVILCQSGKEIISNGTKKLSKTLFAGPGDFVAHAAHIDDALETDDLAGGFRSGN